MPAGFDLLGSEGDWEGQDHPIPPNRTLEDYQNLVNAKSQVIYFGEFLTCTLPIQLILYASISNLYTRMAKMIPY